MRRVVICYRDKTGELVLEPIGFNIAGIGASINRVQVLPSGTSAAQVGAAVRQGLKSSDYSLYDPSANMPVLKATGAKNWGQFAKRRHSVKVRLEEQFGISASARDKTGGFRYGNAKPLPPDVSDEVLGEAVLEAFQACTEGDRPS